MIHATKTIMTLKMTMTRNPLLLLVVFHLLIIGISAYFKETIFLLNFEIAFCVSALIIYTSYQGYQKMIQTSVDNDVHMEVKDPLDQIEDPYDLYDDESSEDIELDQKALKKRMKKNGLKKMVKTTAGHVSWKRLSSYALLVVTFIALKNNDALSISRYLIGLTAGMVAATAIGHKLIKS